MSTPLRGCASATRIASSPIFSRLNRCGAIWLHLHAFDAEIAQIRYAVSEPALGEIRLQWWRDAIAHDQHSGNPLAAGAVADDRRTRSAQSRVRCAPHRQNFRISITIRCRPWPISRVMPAKPASVVGPVRGAGACRRRRSRCRRRLRPMPGVAISLRRALVRFGDDARRRQLFLPRDRFDAGGVDLEDVFAGRPSDGLRQTLADLRGSARVHWKRRGPKSPRCPRRLGQPSCHWR